MSELEGIWEYLPGDDEIDSMAVPNAEDAAMQISNPAEWERAIDDPARQDVATADQDATDVTVSEDEDDGLVHRDAERELDVAELLEQQHYALGPSTEERAW